MRNVALQVSHISGKLNTWADELNREKLGRFAHRPKNAFAPIWPPSWTPAHRPPFIRQKRVGATNAGASRPSHCLEKTWSLGFRITRPSCRYDSIRGHRRAPYQNALNSNVGEGVASETHLPELRLTSEHVR